MSASVFIASGGRRIKLNKKDDCNLRYHPEALTFDIAPGPPNNNLTVFHHFKRLVPELQFMIWDAATDELSDRVIILHPQPVPTLLHVCKDARDRTLRVLAKLELDRNMYDHNILSYGFSEHSNVDVPEELEDEDRPTSAYSIYVNPVSDRVFLSLFTTQGWLSEFMKCVVPGLLSAQVRHLLVDDIFLHKMPQKHSAKLFEEPSSLQSITILRNANFHEFIYEEGDAKRGCREQVWDLGYYAEDGAELVPDNVEGARYACWSQGLKAVNDRFFGEKGGEWSGKLLIGAIYNENPSREEWRKWGTRCVELGDAEKDSTREKGKEDGVVKNKSGHTIDDENGFDVEEKVAGEPPGGAIHNERDLGDGSNIYDHE